MLRLCGDQMETWYYKFKEKGNWMGRTLNSREEESEWGPERTNYTRYNPKVPFSTCRPKKSSLTMLSTKRRSSLRQLKSSKWKFLLPKWSSGSTTSWTRHLRIPKSQSRMKKKRNLSRNSIRNPNQTSNRPEDLYSFAFTRNQKCSGKVFHFFWCLQPCPTRTDLHHIN